MSCRIPRRRASIGVGILLTLGCSAPPPAHVAPPVVTILTAETQQGSMVYRTMIEAHGTLSGNTALIDPVVRVAARIVAAARQSAYGSAAGRLSWEIAVIENEEVRRALVSPRGGIIVYSGLFPVAETEAGLAAVLSHETAHALARHQTADALPANWMPTNEPALFTRDQEMEADQIGLTLMADAGYDPREMLSVWQRMNKMSEEKSGEDPVLSHVTYDRRMALIAAQLPEALLRYERTRRAPQRTLPLASAE